jgi:preprotein translocase subunit SecG
MLLQNTKPNGCSVIVKGASEELMSVFESTGFKNLFKFI